MATAMDVMAALQDALRQQQSGQLVLAEAGYRRVLELQPNQPQALLLLGVLRHQAGHPDEAAELIGQAVQREPLSPQFRLNHGFALKACGRIDEALAEYDEALRLKPDYTVAHFNRAVALEEINRAADAVVAYEGAVASKPDSIDAYNNLCWLLLNLGRYEEALEMATRAIRLQPNLLGLRSCLAAAYSALQRFGEAAACFREAEQLRAAAPPKDRVVFDVERAACMALQGRVEEGLAILTPIASADPGNASARFYRGTMLLTLGRYAEGWAEYEQRWKTRTFRGTLRTFAQPKWDGSTLAGRTILLWAEQGSGDTIQFIRYVPLLARAGALVLVECPWELVDLLSSVEGISQIIPRGETLPPFDVHCALMGLPLLVGTTLETIPRNVPYLHPSVGLRDRWSARIDRDPEQLNVGLARAGSPKHRRDRWRSIPIEKLQPLLNVGGTRWFSLQKGEAAQALGAASATRLTDLDSALTNFNETAAAICAMDLVITVDTSVAHLAGALGKPTWVLLPTPADFRWMLGRADTPWYPTMRLFRQGRYGDWDEVIARAATALDELSRESKNNG